MSVLTDMARSLIKKSFVATCAGYLADDYWRGVRFRRGAIETGSGMTHASRSVDSSLGYIEGVVADYRRYSSVNRFTGRIAEVGPGDNCGVGLMFLADGCNSVDLVDRFYSKRSSSRNAEIYQTLIARHPQLATRLRGADVGDETTFAGLTRRYGASASAEQFFRRSRGYDFIVSRSVMEHISDPGAAIRNMATALNPGGMLLHKVDLRDHGMFSGNFHELKFLEVPDGMYRRMTRNAGRPNRMLVHEYRSVLREVLQDHEILVTRLAGAGEIVPHLRYEQIGDAARQRSLTYVQAARHHFASSLRTVSDEDLSVAGFFMVARKSGTETAGESPS